MGLYSSGLNLLALGVRVRRSRTVVGLLFTASPLFAGPLAVGIFAESSLGYLLGFAVSAVLYGVLGRGLRGRPVTPPAADDREEEAATRV